MLFALTILARDTTNAVICGGREYRLAYSDDDDSIISIEPQATIGKYRVDFLVKKRTVYGPIDPVTKKTVAGQEIPIEVQVIVECDGHEFHERTKEQAAYDRKRDRALQEVGFKVFRFTGSEIWADVFACASETIEALNSEERRRLGEIRLSGQTEPSPDRS